MEAMNKTWPKPKYVVRSDGSVLTLGDLPSAKTTRWVISRKTIVVDAVRGGIISLEDACWRYSLTLEEFYEWQSAIDRRRLQALNERRIGNVRAYDAAGHRPKEAPSQAPLAQLQRPSAASRTNVLPRRNPIPTISASTAKSPGLTDPVESGGPPGSRPIPRLSSQNMFRRRGML